MSQPYNLVANIQLQLENGQLSAVNSQLRNALRGGVNVPINIDARSSSGIANITRSLGSAQDALRGTSAAALRTSDSIRGMARVSVDASGFLENLATQAGLATRRVLGFSVAATAVYRLGGALKSAVQDALDFSRTMLKIEQISTESAAEIRSVANEVTRLATSLGVPSRELVNVAEQLKQTGLSARETKEALSALAQASLAPSFGNMVRTTQGAVAAMREFGLEARDLVNVMGSINAVSTSFAVEAEDVIEAVKRAGGSFRAAGGDLNEFIGLFTAVRATTRESAESIATGMRTIFGRLQRSDSVEAMRALGVNLRYSRQEAEALGRTDLTGQFVGAYEAVRRLNEGLSGLRATDPRYAQIIERLGGQREIGRVLPLIQQFGEAQRAATAAQSGGLSVTLAAERAQGNLSVEITKTKEAWLALTRSFVESNSFQSLAQGALGFASSLATLIGWLKPLLPLLTALATVKIGQSIAGIFSGQGAFANFGRVLTSPTGAALSPQAIRRAGGGWVPGTGSGKVDTVPAMLAPGEFVLSTDDVRRMGGPHAIESMRRGYASGGEVRALKAEASRKINYGPTHDFFKNAIANPKIRALIPSGSTFLGNGTKAFVLNLPNGNVLRVDNKSNGQRPQIDEMLQPVSSQVVDDFLVEELPYVPDLRKSKVGWGRRQRIEEAMRNRIIRKYGVKPRDLTSDNIGIAPGNRIKIIDPGQGFHKGGLVQHFAEGGPVLPQYLVEQLITRNAQKLYDNFLKKRDSSRYDEHITGGLMAAANLFDPLKLTNKETGKPYTEAEVASGATDKLFLKYASENIRGRASSSERTAARRSASLANAARSGLIATSVNAGGQVDLDEAEAAAREQRVLAGTLGSVIAAGGQNARRVPVGNIKDVLAARRAGRAYTTSVPPKLITDARSLPLVHVPSRGGVEDADFTVRPTPAPDPRRLTYVPGPLEDPEMVREAAVDNARRSGQAQYRRTQRLINRRNRQTFNVDEGTQPQYESQLHPVDKAVQAIVGAGLDPDSVRAKRIIASFGVSNSTVRDQVNRSRVEQSRREEDIRDRNRENTSVTLGGAVDTLNILHGRTFGVANSPINPLTPGQIDYRVAEFNRTHYPHPIGPTPSGGFDATASDFYSPEGYRPPGHRSVLLGDLTASQARRRARGEIEELGGASVLSSQTKNTIIHDTLLKQENENRREFLAAQKNLIQATVKGVSAKESERIAEEDYNRAIAGEVRVLRDRRNGRIIGTADRLEALPIGARTPGAGLFFNVGQGLREFGGGIADFAGRNFGQESRANQVLGRFGNRLGGRAALNTALFTLPFLASGADSLLAGTAEQAVAGGREGSYRAGRGTSGAIQGAVVGATLGSAIPGVGTAIGTALGAGIGAITGFVSALKEASDEIRQVRLGNAMTTFADRLNTLNQTLAGHLPDATAVSNTLSSITEARSLIRENSEQQAHAGFLGFFGPDTRAFAENQRAGLRQNFGQSSIGPFLTAQAERAGRTNTGNLSVDQLVEQFRGGNNGLNRQFVNILAQTRGLSSGEVLREFRVAIERGQRQRAVDERRFDARSGEERGVNSFERLVHGLEAAVESLQSLQVRSRLLADSFDGASNAIHVSTNAEALHGIGRGDAGALVPLSLLRDVGGQQGRNLFNTGRALDSVRNVLPSILSQVARESPTEGAHVVTRVQERILSALGHTSATAPAEVQQILRTVSSQLDSHLQGEHGLRNFFEGVQIDPTKLSEELVGPVSTPLREAAQRSARLLEQESNRFIDGLTTVRRQMVAIGENRDRLVSIQTAGYRQNIEIAAQRSGRTAQAHDFFDLNVLERPFTSRQERLTGLSGRAATDPATIAERLAVTEAAIQAAGQRQQELAGRGRDFSAVALELQTLRSRAADYRQALEHLTNSSERNANVQERLANIQRERESRLSVGEQFATADAEGRLHIQRGVLLANQANERGNLDNLTTEDQRLVIETLRSFGGATLSGFRGSPRADDLRNNLISNSFGGAFRLNPSQQAEETRLQDVVIQRLGDASEAMSRLIASQQNASTKFFDDLSRQHELFFARFNEILNRNQLVDVQNRVGAESGRLGTLGGLARQRDLLGSVGITTTEGLSSLQSRRGAVDQLASAISAEQQQISRRDQALASLQEPSFGIRGARRGFNNFQIGEQDYFARLHDNLASAGLDSNQINQVGALVNRRVNGSFATNPSVRGNEIRGFIAEAIQEVFSGAPGTVRGRARSDIENAQRQLGDVPGLNVSALTRVLGGDRRNDFTSALGSFNTTNQRLEDLNGNISRTTQLFNDLTDQLGRLRAILATPTTDRSFAPSVPGGSPYAPTAPAGYFADGGIFRPRGTDVVPAMLTPDEFVVNAASSRANRALLHRINNARGPAFLAEGGTPGVFAWDTTPTAQVTRRNNPTRPSGLYGQGVFAWDTSAPGTRQGTQPTGQWGQGVAAWGLDAPGGRGVQPNGQWGQGVFAWDTTPASLPGRVLDAYRPADNIYGNAAVMPLVRSAQAPARQGTRPSGRWGQGVFGWDTTRRRTSRSDLFAPYNAGNTAYDAPGGLSDAYGRVANPYGFANGGVVYLASGGLADLFGTLQAPERARDQIRQNFDGLRRVRMLAQTGNWDNQARRAAVGQYYAIQQGNLAQRQALANAVDPFAAFGAGRADFQGAQNVAQRANSIQTDYRSFRYLPELQGYFAQGQNQVIPFSGGGVVPQYFGSGGPIGRIADQLTPTFLGQNSFIGPKGSGTNNIVPVTQPLPYTVDYTNVATVVGPGTQVPPPPAPPVQGTRGYANGGPVYMADGGSVASGSAELGQALASFAGNASALAESINRMPRTLTGTFTHQVNVIHNGAEVLSTLAPGVQQLVITTVNEALRNVFNNQLPQAGVNI